MQQFASAYGITPSTNPSLVLACQSPGCCRRGQARLVQSGRAAEAASNAKHEFQGALGTSLRQVGILDSIEAPALRDRVVGILSGEVPVRIVQRLVAAEAAGYAGLLKEPALEEYVKSGRVARRPVDSKGAAQPHVAPASVSQSPAVRSPAKSPGRMPPKTPRKAVRFHCTPEKLAALSAPDRSPHELKAAATPQTSNNPIAVGLLDKLVIDHIQRCGPLDESGKARWEHARHHLGSLAPQPDMQQLAQHTFTANFAPDAAPAATAASSLMDE
ncbi:hypothetical protein [Ramlibacter aurantiacus]|nr:hypothetical protein [Ramlibacter aurantiacus]